MPQTKQEDMEWYDLGEAQCPSCGYPVFGYFQDGKLVRTGPCAVCNNDGE